IRNKENVRKTYFAFKLIFLVILEVFYAGNTLISPFLVQYEILNHVIRALIFLLSTNLIFSLGRIITLRIYLQQREETKVQPNFVVGIDRIEFLLNLLAILISLMLAFGIRPLEFLTSITIVAAAIALLTKDYITNIVNGLIMMFSDQLEIGDKVQIGRHTGFIRDITLINLVLKNDAGEIILIPNTMALTTDVVNYSKNNTHQLIFDAELSFKKELHLTELERVLEVILEQYALVVQKEGAQLTLLDRKIDTVSIRYQFPIKSGEKETELQVKKSINQALIDWQYAVQKGELL
ncbi:MAG: mechanosensitive ion channel family protein, partial [Algoriphagus sp.]|nr:mechanosensitive ion channel family protein [Algoriphagus sp.]